MAPAVALAWEPAIDYLASSHLSLVALDPELAQATGLKVTRESGPRFDFALSDTAQLHLLAPAEQFVDSHSTLRIEDAHGRKRWRLRLNWSSHFNPALQRIEEGREDGAHVSVQGVNVYGFVNADTTLLQYRIVPAAGLDPAGLSISMSGGDVRLDATRWFQLNPALGLLSLKSEQLPTLIMLLRENSHLQLSFSVSDAQAARTVSFFHTLTYAPTTLNLVIGDAHHQSVSGHSGTRFVVRRSDGAFAMLTAVDMSGRAQIRGLPPGSYEVEEVRLDRQVPLATSLRLRVNDLTVDQIITVPPEHPAAVLPGTVPAR